MYQAAMQCAPAAQSSPVAHVLPHVHALDSTSVLQLRQLMHTATDGSTNGSLPTKLYLTVAINANTRLMRAVVSTDRRYTSSRLVAALPW